MSAPRHPDPLDAEFLRRALPVRVEVLAECDSTNSRLLDTAGEEPLLLACEWQHAGRGRQGAKWHGAPEGSLSFSLRWSFACEPRQLAGLSLAVGVACVRALLACGIEVALKWPNDLVHARGKLGGILIEMRPGTSTAVIGIGLNVRNAALLQADIAQPICDLQQIATQVPARNVLLSGLVLELIAVLREFDAQGFAVFRAEWQRHHAHAGQRVSLQHENMRIEGIASGVAEDGALLLSTESGERRFLSGELSLRKAA